MTLTDVFVCTQVGAAEAGTGATRERKTRTRAAGKREAGERKTNCCRSGNTWAGQDNYVLFSLHSFLMFHYLCYENIPTTLFQMV